LATSLSLTPPATIAKAAEVKNFIPALYFPSASQADVTLRSVGTQAAEEAIVDSGMNWQSTDREGVGIFIGGGAGGILSAESTGGRCSKKDGAGPGLPFFFLCDLRPDRLPRPQIQHSGPARTIATACSSSATALAMPSAWSDPEKSSWRSQGNVNLSPRLPLAVLTPSAPWTKTAAAHLT